MQKDAGSAERVPGAVLCALGVLRPFSFLDQSLKKMPPGPFAGEPSGLLGSIRPPNDLHADWLTSSENLPLPKCFPLFHGHEIVSRQITFDAAHRLSMSGTVSYHEA
jgi:hypothetical protein